MGAPKVANNPSYIPADKICDIIYPIGSIYISVNNVSPANLFNCGKWERIEDRFLLAAGSSYTAGSTGGSKTHSHKLSSSGYAKIGFTWLDDYNTLVQASTTYPNEYYSGTKMPNLPAYSSLQSSNVSTPLGGVTDSESSLPPYLAVYIWKRVS